MIWWIVRDGLGRELLRPVALWQEPGGNFALTLNSHGQANALTCAPEVSTLTRMPQGVRAVVTDPFPRVTGYLSTSGLVLYEVAVGILAATAGRPASPLLLVLASGVLTSQGAAGMQTGYEVAQRAPPLLNPWTSLQTPSVTIMRIWSHTGDAPLELPYQEAPDPARLLSRIAGTRRGIPGVGDFIWTQPRIIQGVAHLLHVPPRMASAFSFWLLHFRGRGHVVAASIPHFDWAYVGNHAAEAFGKPWFSQGHVGVFLQGRVVPYGSQFPLPPSGAVLHMVRTSLQPSTGGSCWDTPSEPAFVSHFDFDVCVGASGAPAIIGYTTTARHSERAGTAAGSGGSPQRPLCLQPYLLYRS